MPKASAGILRLQSIQRHSGRLLAYARGDTFRRDDDGEIYYYRYRLSKEQLTLAGEVESLNNLPPYAQCPRHFIFQRVGKALRVEKALRNIAGLD